MEREAFILQQIKKQGLLPLFYHEQEATCIAITNALYAAGVRCIEFTNRGKHAQQHFAQLVKYRDASLPDLLLGIGTVQSEAEATSFISIGADFLVSPFFDHSICDVAYMNKVLWIPGCMTPTEIHSARIAGCKMIKLFPGSVLQPVFAEALQPLFPDVDFLVTGGVDSTEYNIKSWFKAGVAAVGIGSKLVTPYIVENNAFEELQKTTAKLLALIERIREQ